MVEGLTGQFGGMIAAAFGAGCASGWGFAMKIMTPRIAELRKDFEDRDLAREKEISELKAKVNAFDNLLMQAIGRQLNGGDGVGAKG